MSLGHTLTAAILCGRNDAIEMLLTAGADVDAQNDQGLSASLSAAIIRKDSRLVQRLLAAGATVNGVYSFEEFRGESFLVSTTVLPAVVSWGDYSLIQDIINAGADVNVPNYPEGETALAVAIRRGDAMIVELLINTGANVNSDAALLFGPTALEAASRNNGLGMVWFLLGLGADLDEWSLVEAVSGSVELMQTLLVARLDRYHRYSKGYGCRALQHAINTKNANMVEVQLANGIDANVIIQRRLEDGPELESPKPGFPSRRPTIVFEVSALGRAIEKDESNDLWIVQMLLNSRADPNSIVTDYFDYYYYRFQKRTALLIAIDCYNLATAKKLINAGADLNPGARLDISGTPL